MSSPVVKVVINKSKYPFTKREEDAGYDLYADQHVTISVGDTVAVQTDVVINILTSGYYTRIAPRSGLGMKGIMVGAGVVDSRYQKPIAVLLYNAGKEPFVVTPGMRIAQAIFEAAVHPEITSVDDVGSAVASERGTNGFGSSGL